MNVRHNTRVFTLEKSLVTKLCRAIDSPRSLAVALLIQNNEWDQLVDLRIQPTNYFDAYTFASDYLVSKILSKNPRIPLNVDRRAAAIAKFRAAEATCAESNRRIRSFVRDPQSVDPDLLRVVTTAQRKIYDILGPCPTKSDLDFAEENMRFGPGATTSVSRIVTQGKKYSLRTPEVTTRLLPFRTFCFPDLWKENCLSIKVRDTSKLAVVPKNAKTDRVICIEPDLNIFVQLGIGHLLKRKLKLFGLDLLTQRHNQEAAQAAYRCGNATVDLSSASDTISREAVWLLLPYAWCDLLHLCRVDNTCIDDEVVPLQKWSSMGNGYTFELETIIFHGVCLAVCECLGLDTSTVLTYGDDMVVPVAALELLTRALNFLGFSVNSDKTFGEGPFHESCGADYFLGQNVRPVFLRSEHHDYESICYLYANNLRRWANRLCDGSACDGRVLPAWLHCFGAVKPNHRHLIPEGVGDQGFIESFDRSKPSVRYDSRRKYGWAGFNFSYRRVKSFETVVDPLGAYFGSLSNGLTDFKRGREALRGRFIPPSTKIGYSLEWPSLGPWI